MRFNTKDKGCEAEEQWLAETVKICKKCDLFSVIRNSCDVKEKKEINEKFTKNKGRRTFFSEILGILQIIPNIIPNLGILGRDPSEPSMLGGFPNADRNIPFRAFIQCSVGARTHTIIK